MAEGLLVELQGGKAAKLLTAVRDRVSTFVSLTSENILKETFGQFQAVFMEIKMFFLKPKHDDFLTLTLCLNLTRAQGVTI